MAEHPELAGRYPELDGALIERLAALHGLDPEMIALGNGADAIIGYLSEAYLRPGDEVVTGWPSFPTYLSDAAKQQATVVRVPLRDGAMDLEAMAAAIGPRTRLVWVCTPNNPTGGAIGADALDGFLEAVDERVLVVVDEAYIEFCEPGTVADAIAEQVRARPNVASLRTFSKLFGLAGMRVGWLAAPAPIAAAVGRSRHYYDIGGLSALMALASLDDPAELRRRRRAERAAALASAGRSRSARLRVAAVARQLRRGRCRRRRRRLRAAARRRGRDAVAGGARRARAAAGDGRLRGRDRPAAGAARRRTHDPNVTRWT